MQPFEVFLRSIKLDRDLLMPIEHRANANHASTEHFGCQCHRAGDAREGDRDTIADLGGSAGCQLEGRTARGHIERPPRRIERSCAPPEFAADFGLGPGKRSSIFIAHGCHLWVGNGCPVRTSRALSASCTPSSSTENHTTKERDRKNHRRCPKQGENHGHQSAHGPITSMPEPLRGRCRGRFRERMPSQASPPIHPRAPNRRQSPHRQHKKARHS